MIVIKELSGASYKGYSDAVQSIIEELLADGETVLWFETVQQRGAVRNGKIEFQVVVKVGLK